ncbi:MAG: pseudouridine-5'-phosphate glycosidase [Firmicutes bacterium]|nr:pseudouridine-5'-phosphate glycosidase [Bacillota bacterium]
MMEYFDIHPEIKDAMQQLLPVVVIESTVWVHGLPEEYSIPALVECQKIIRQEGAIPAIVGISDGRIKIGLGAEDISAMIDRKRARKVNLRDIPQCIQKREDGATTVSATLFMAHRMGLPLVVTGGMGGVHRQAEKTFDISADLTTLATTPVALVTSGIKSILNIPATLEYMETAAIPVIGYRTDSFPTFYCSSSNLPVPERMDEVDEIAGILRIRQKIGMKQGVLIANPVPQEYSLGETFLEEVVEKSLFEAQEMEISGKDVTPFLLERLHTLTSGKTIQANIALLKENAALGARLAKYLYY